MVQLRFSIPKLENFNVRPFLQKAGLLVEATAKLNCPVETGTLRRSITHEVNDDTVYIGTNLEYAPYVEYGTGLFAEKGDGRQTPWKYQDVNGDWHTTAGQHGHPYLRPALTTNQQNISDILQEEIEK